MNNKSFLIRKISLIGALGALTVLLGITPIGFIRLPLGLAITLLHIPTIVGTFLAGGIGGTCIGAIFGIFSLFKAASNPVGLDALFVNPLISVLPRLLLAPTVFLIFKAFNKIKNMPKSVSAAVSAVLGTLFHTVYVSLALYIFAGSQVTQLMEGKGLGAFIVLLLPNAIAESIAAAIISAAVIGVISSTGKKSKLSQINQTEESVEKEENSK